MSFTIYVFQTPSARGGIPLSKALEDLDSAWVNVSNPFSAGRDSSVKAMNHQIAHTAVSNPFSAGRDSSVAR